METQVGIVLNDTEVLHSSQDYQTGYDTEVVPDSEDEIMDCTDSKRSSRVCTRFIERLVGDMDKVESPFHPSCEKLECSTDDCDDGEHVSGQTTTINVCQNGGCLFNVHHGMQVTHLNTKDVGIKEVKDPCSDHAIACGKNCIDNVEKLSEENKDDESGKTSHSKRRDVSIVYTRKRKNSCNVEANDVVDEKRSPNRSDEYAGLSYVESQEPEDVSKALLFVDQYICASAIQSSPVANFKVRDKSLSAQSTKGACNLIRRANFRNREGERGIFEWDAEQDGDGHSDPLGNSGQLPFRGKNYDQTYVRRSQSVRSMISKDIGTPGVLGKEKTEQLKDLTQTEATMAMHNCVNARVTENLCDNEPSLDSKVLDQQVDEDSTVMQLEAGAVHEESEHAFDIGINTQMAAEAIQALSYAVSTDCSEVDADKYRHKVLDRSSENSQKRNIAGDWSFPKKARSASRGAVSRPKQSRKMFCSTNRNSEIQASKFDTKRNSRKLGARKCMDGQNSDNSPRVDFTHKRKVNGAKDVKVDSFKENLRSFVSTEQSPLHKVKCKRKDSGTYPVAGDLKLSNLFNTNKGLITEPIDAKTDGKVDPYDKRKKRVIIDKLVISDQKENHPKPLYEESVNMKNMKVSEEDPVYQVVDDSADGKVYQMEIGLNDKDNKGVAKMLRVSGPDQYLSKLPCTKFNHPRSTGTGQPNASYVPSMTTNWYSRDYPRGKRTRKNMLELSGVSHVFNNSPVRVKGEECGCHHLKGRLDLEGCSNSSFNDFNIRKKRRSSAYVSPCWLLSQKNCEKSFVSPNADELRETDIVSEHLIGSTIALQHDKSDNIGSASTMPDEKRTDVLTTLARKNKSGNAASPSNLIDDCHQHGKKKASPSLTRELVRLGFRESMPEFTPKDSRRRKTMANIQVLLSKNLDKRVHMQQKKILMRLGVSMASCPSNATHFVADTFARTRNMLEFIALGKPVVTPMWLESCHQAGFYIDETNYILRDMKREQELDFRLPFSLDRARKHPLLKGYRVIITPNTKPVQEMLISLVKAVHGQAVDMQTDHIMKTNLQNLLIFSCEEDQAYCLPFLERGVSAYSSELLLNGIIIQKLEFERHRLFTDHVIGY